MVLALDSWRYNRQVPVHRRQRRCPGACWVQRLLYRADHHPVSRGFRSCVPTIKTVCCVAVHCKFDQSRRSVGMSRSTRD